MQLYLSCKNRGKLIIKFVAQSKPVKTKDKSQTNFFFTKTLYSVVQLSNVFSVLRTCVLLQYNYVVYLLMCVETYVELIEYKITMSRRLDWQFEMFRTFGSFLAAATHKLYVVFTRRQQIVVWKGSVAQDKSTDYRSQRWECYATHFGEDLELK